MDRSVDRQTASKSLIAEAEVQDSVWDLVANAAQVKCLH